MKDDNDDDPKRGHHLEDMRRWKDNINVSLKYTECENMNWVHLVRDRFKLWDFVNTMMDIRVEKKQLISYPPVSEN
jgi:hypothetical protein